MRPHITRQGNIAPRPPRHAAHHYPALRCKYVLLRRKRRSERLENRCAKCENEEALEPSPNDSRAPNFRPAIPAKASGVCNYATA